MTTTTTKKYRVGVIERAISYYEVEAENARIAAETWEEGEFKEHDDEALDSDGPCNVREKQPDGTWLKIPKSQWEDMPCEIQEANARLATAVPAMLEALLLAQRALNTAPRFRVGDMDSYQIAAIVDRAVKEANARREP